MSDPFIAQITMFGGNFAPRSWAFCQGQLLQISTNTALFSLLGTTFGGDGRTTFGLPDLRGRSPVGVGTGPGLDTITWGEKSGAVERSLTVNQMPNHNHGGGLRCNSGTGDSDTPVNAYLAPDENATEQYHTAQNASTGSLSIPAQGGGQPVNIRSPFLGIYFIIALQGVFPSRN